jgi:hypothetical protein
LRRAFELAGNDHPDEAVRRVRERFAVSRHASTASLDGSRHAGAPFVDVSRNGVTPFLEPVDLPVVESVGDVEPVSSFAVVAELSDAPTELLPDVPDSAFAIVGDDPPGLDDPEAVLELSAAPLMDSPEENSADVDLSAAISALGAAARPGRPTRRRFPAWPKRLDSLSADSSGSTGASCGMGSPIWRKRHV